RPPARPPAAGAPTAARPPAQGSGLGLRGPTAPPALRHESAADGRRAPACTSRAASAGPAPRSRPSEASAARGAPQSSGRLRAACAAVKRARAALRGLTGGGRGALEMSTAAKPRNGVPRAACRRDLNFPVTTRSDWLVRA
ncbi:PREDICTED: translation initiation factor IF-2-like, partial [Chinchilla lanigera]|uniref:translation initiation factor IF-2-like n=1 Tax=Chinchilla lanigera TaxID=34839 RepID=UPI000695BBEE